LRRDAQFIQAALEELVGRLAFISFLENKEKKQAPHIPSCALVKGGDLPTG
jgi:hypothetical protein